MLTRYPDGIRGKSFFQKDAPAETPAWVRTARIRSEPGGREIATFVCDDLETLLYLANLGTIPLHVWSSRIASIDRPDWASIDLDPKGAPFPSVVRVARAVHALCRRIGLPDFVKTSGATGLHVLLPLGAQVDHGGARTIAEAIARIVERAEPGIATTVRTVADRGGKVYVDYLQNGRGKTLAAPFCARPLPGAPVSMPLRWSEVGARLSPSSHTIATAPGRMRRLGRDPMRPLLDAEVDLPAVLARLDAAARDVHR